MQFLKTLFWVMLAVALVLFSTVNWAPVTINLWGGLQADIRLPVLLVAAFLAGFLPMFAIHRARLWSLRRRLDMQDRSNVVTAPPAPRPAPTSSAPHDPDGRTATDSDVWPAR